MKTETKKKQRIGSMQGGLMIAVAAVVDIVQILLVLFFGVGLLVNRFITIFAFMMFFFWFALNRVSFLTGRMSMKKMTRFFGTAFGEVIPVLGALPLWAFGIWLTLRSVKKEDEIVYNKNKKGIVRKVKTAIKVAKVARAAKKVISRGR